MKSPLTHHADPLPDEDIDEISAIKVFAYIKHAIESIDTPPLTSKDLEINSDAYEELGNGNTDGTAFARIGILFPKKNSGVQFDMAFTEEGVVLGVGGADYIFSHYAHLGENEKEVADKLVTILIGLSNGQLAILSTVTQYDEKLQAWEILYREPGKHLYDAIATYAIFDSARKLKNKQLITQKFSNAANIDDVSIDIEAYRLFLHSTDWQYKFNRKQINGLHLPLTREDWEKSVEKYYDDKADEMTKKVDAWANKDPRSLWEQILHAVKWRHIELMWWSLALIVYRPITEGSVESLPLGFYIFGAYVVAATIYRNNSIFNKYFSSVRLSAYAGYVLASIIYLSYGDGSTWWIALGAASFITFLENIFFDIHSLYMRRRLRSS
jgi:hypothetical protein